MTCKVETFSRVTGFYRPVQQWNPGKGVRGEFGDRKHYDTEVYSATNPKDNRIPESRRGV